MDNIINKKEKAGNIINNASSTAMMNSLVDSNKLMRVVVIFNRYDGIFKVYYSWWADSIMANACRRRRHHPGSIPGPSTATIGLIGGRYG